MRRLLRCFNSGEDMGKEAVQVIVLVQGLDEGGGLDQWGCQERMLSM